LFFVLLTVAACGTVDRQIEQNFEHRDYPLPEVINPVVAPVATVAGETSDRVLQERTLKDTTTPGKKGGYRATLFPADQPESDDGGTAFKLSW